MHSHHLYFALLGREVKADMPAGRRKLVLVSSPSCSLKLFENTRWVIRCLLFVEPMWTKAWFIYFSRIQLISLATNILRGNSTRFSEVMTLVPHMLLQTELVSFKHHPNVAISASTDPVETFSLASLMPQPCPSTKFRLLHISQEAAREKLYKSAAVDGMFSPTSSKSIALNARPPCTIQPRIA